MVNKIVIRAQYWEDDKIISDHNGAFMTDNLTMVQIREFSKRTFQRSMSSLLTDCLVK